MEQILEGGCACGKSRYQITKKPMFVHCCHCHLCQQQTGSAFILHAFLEPEYIKLISGNLTTHDMPAGSGQRHIVKRCANCATGIISHYGPENTLSIIKVGTLDNPSLMPPDAHIFINDKLDWVTLAMNIPSFEKFYDFGATWPKESYMRLLKVRENNK
jgi:hypothetical protein